MMMFISQQQQKMLTRRKSSNSHYTCSKAMSQNAFAIIRLIGKCQDLLRIMQIYHHKFVERRQMLRASGSLYFTYHCFLFCPHSFEPTDFISELQILRSLQPRDTWTTTTPGQRDFTCFWINGLDQWITLDL